MRFRSQGSILTNKGRVDRCAKEVAEKYMDFLDAGRAVAGHDQAMVGELFRSDGAAVAAGEAGRYKSLIARRLQRGDDVRRIAGGREPDQEIAFPAKCGDLAGENQVEAEIVAGGGQGGGVGGQRNGRKRPPLGLEADCQFRSNVLAVGRTAAIAAQEKLAPGPEHRYSRFGEGRGRNEERFGPLDAGEMFVKEVFEVLREFCAVRAHANAPSIELSGTRSKR